MKMRSLSPAVASTEGVDMTAEAKPGEPAAAPTPEIAAPQVRNAPAVLEPGDLPGRAMQLVTRNLLIAEHLQMAIAEGVRKKHFSYGPDAASALNSILKSNEQLLKVHQLFEPRSNENRPDAKKIDPEQARAIAAKLARALDGPGTFIEAEVLADDVEPEPIAEPVKAGKPKKVAKLIDVSDPQTVGPEVEDRLRAALDGPQTNGPDENYPAVIAQAAAEKLRRKAQAGAVVDPAAAAEIKTAKADGKAVRDALAELRGANGRNYARGAKS